jgi:hypothetical protein
MEPAEPISPEDLKLLRDAWTRLTDAEMDDVGLSRYVITQVRKNDGKLRPSLVRTLVAEINALDCRGLSRNLRPTPSSMLPAFPDMIETVKTYSFLLEHIRDAEVKHAQVVQLSASWIRPVIREIIKNDGHTVDLYIQDPRVACPVRLRIRVIEFLMNFRTDLSISREGGTSKLNIFLYSGNPDGRRVCILDDEVVALSEFKTLLPSKVPGDPFWDIDSAESTLAQEPYKLYKRGVGKAGDFDSGLSAARQSIGKIRELCSRSTLGPEPAIVAEGRSISKFDDSLAAWLKQKITAFNNGGPKDRASPKPHN